MNLRFVLLLLAVPHLFHCGPPEVIFDTTRHSCGPQLESYIASDQAALDYFSITADDVIPARQYTVDVAWPDHPDFDSQVVLTVTGDPYGIEAFRADPGSDCPSGEVLFYSIPAEFEGEYGPPANGRIMVVEKPGVPATRILQFVVEWDESQLRADVRQTLLGKAGPSRAHTERIELGLKVLPGWAAWTLIGNYDRSLDFAVSRWSLFGEVQSFSEAPIQE
ncbi:MAG: hypothetical protein AB8H79_20990 [Myxococcota bacterium]